jgi:peptide/nickel transport system substrate-binding protein
MINSTEEFDLSGLLSFGLFGFDWEMQPFASADAVVSWESSADGMYDKVVLRDDLLWSDGQPITAEDVAFSFRVIMNPDVDIPAVRSQTNELKLVHAYDPRTVVFFHKQPLVTNVWNVNFPIIPRHVYEKSWPDDVKLVNSPAHRKLEDQPITGGPYEIESRKAQQEIVLKRRENYYLVNGRQVREKPYFKQIRFRIVTDPNTALLSLQRGDIEELELSMQHWQTRTGGNDFYARNTKARAPEWTYFYFGWNNRHPIFQDPAVRQAMGFAFDHQEMLTTQNFGLTQPSVGMFHPESWMFPKTPDKPREQDLDRALDLLADAGWEDTDNDGILDKEIDGKQKKFEFIMLCLNDPNRIEHCALLKNNLEKLGILCTVRPMELAALIEKMRKRDFEAYFGGWGTGTDPDTSENLWTTSAIEDGRNYVGYSNPAVDGLYLLGKQLQTNTAIREKICRDYGLAKVGITPAATRAEIYAKIHEVLYADQPVTFLYFRSSFYGFNKDLRGIHFSPRGPYHYSPGFSAIHKPSLR